MNGNAQKLIKYMDGASKRFVIPVYQRNYDWKMEHCKQLYDDLVKVIRQNRKKIGRASCRERVSAVV